jgi:hypothetical protein
VCVCVYIWVRGYLFFLCFILTHCANTHTTAAICCCCYCLMIFLFVFSTVKQAYSFSFKCFLSLYCYCLNYYTLYFILLNSFFFFSCCSYNISLISYIRVHDDYHFLFYLTSSFAWTHRFLFFSSSLVLRVVMFCCWLVFFLQERSII